MASERLTTTLAATYSRYHYNISSNGNPTLNSDLSYNLTQTGGQADASYLLNDRHVLSAGLSSLLYQVRARPPAAHGGRVAGGAAGAGGGKKRWKALCTWPISSPFRRGCRWK